MSRTMLSRVPLSALPVGAKLKAPIFDAYKTKLLGAGLEITGHLVETLQKRCVSEIVVDMSDMARIQAFKPQGKARNTLPDREIASVNTENDLSRVMDRSVEGGAAADLAASENPFASRAARPGLVQYDRDFTNHLADTNEASITQLDDIVKACLQEDSSEIEFTSNAVRGILDGLTTDIDAVACLGANPFMHSYPSRHSQHVAMLAVCIGTTLGLDEKKLMDVGVGCLVHDIGMLAIDEGTYKAERVLELGEYAEITKHPFKTFDLIEENVDVIPPDARMVAYQMHERCNGKGYPRKREAAQTHPLARLAAVADAYVALVCPRPHRPGMLPYFAMERLIKGVNEGAFDARAVRALLETIGLFPIGSYVHLTENFVGRVIRTNGAQFAKPVVEVWKRTNLSANPSIVDLCQDNRLQIQKPVTSLNA